MKQTGIYTVDITIKQLITLAEEIGLPYIVRKEMITIIGEQEFLEFGLTTSGGTQCQLIRTY